MRNSLDDVLSHVQWGAMINERVRNICVDHALFIIEQNKTINLTRIVEPFDVAVKHILDSLWLIPVLEAWEMEIPKSLLDIGTGGGWPFVPLAAYFDCRATASEKIKKKGRVLEEVFKRLLPKAKLFNRQIMELQDEQFDLVVNRAVGPLNRIFQSSYQTVARGGIWVSYKGPKVEEELDEWHRLLDIYNFRQCDIVRTELPDQSTRIFVGAVKK